MGRKLSNSRIHEFSLVDNFQNGYRHREDKTNLPANVMVTGSQNVLTNTSGRIGVRQGYQLDGAASTSGVPLLSSYNFFTFKGVERPLRAGFLTSAANDGKLQYRYVNSAGTVTWIDLLSSLTSVKFQFTDFWDFTTEKIMMCLFVNGTSNVYEWSGAVTTYASSTSNTITKQGITTWAEEGFYTSGTRKITIGGVDYTYTGGESTTTLTGVSPDPTGAGIAVGAEIHQTPRVTAASGITSLPATFALDLISNLNNQIYYGSLVNASVYVSVVNNYKSVDYTSPVRVVGEGGLLTLDNPIVGFRPQENTMYISAGKDFWYTVVFTLSADLSKESLTITRLKTASKQGAFSQNLISKDKNDIIFISNEPVLSTIGRVANNLATPQAGDLSYPIVDDFNSFDFTDGQVQYWKNFLFVSIPKEGKIFIYNQTDPNHTYWEVPQLLPIGRMTVIAGELYGHSYLTSETYKLFTGYNDNGNAIDARIRMAFSNLGSRPVKKNFDKFYAEGYMTQNGTLTIGVQYDIDGLAQTVTRTLPGTDQTATRFFF